MNCNKASIQVVSLNAKSFYNPETCFMGASPWVIAITPFLTLAQTLLVVSGSACPVGLLWLLVVLSSNYLQYS